MKTLKYISLAIISTYVLLFLFASVKYPERLLGLEDSFTAQVAGTLENGLIAYYQFDGNANDSGPKGLNGVVNGSANYTNGKLGQAISLNGTDNYITIPTDRSLQLKKNYTYSFWLNLASTQQAWAGISSRTIDGSTQQLDIQFSSTGDILRLDHGANTGTDSSISLSALTGGWHLLTVTFNNQKAKIYIDGSLQETLPMPITAVSGNGPLYLGREEAGITLKGAMDEVRIYSRALTATEVQAIYTYNGSTVIVPPPPPEIVTCSSFTYSDWNTCTNGNQTRTVTASAPTNCEGGSPVLSQSCTIPTCTYNNSNWSTCTNSSQTRTLTAQNQPCTGETSKVETQSCVMPIVTCSSFTYSAWNTCTNGNQTRTVTASAPTNCVNGSPILSQSCTVDTGAVASYPFSGNLNNTVSTSWNGTCTNCPTLTTDKSNVAQKAYAFTGAQSVSVGDLDQTGNFTLAFGFKASSFPTSGSWQSLVMKANDYGCELDQGNAVSCYIGNGSSWTATTKATNLTANTWYHVAAVYSGSTLSLYLNGSLITTAIGTHTTNNSPLLMGSWNGSSEFFTGSLDEVNVYNRALSASEIVTLSGSAPAIPPNACTYNNPAWSTCTNNVQTRTLTAQNQPCTGEVSKVESQGCGVGTGIDCSNLTTLQTVVNNAARGATITCNSGNYTWNGTLSLTKGITLKSINGRDSTTIKGNSTIISIIPDATAIANEEIVRVEGFTFDGNNLALNLITVEGAGPNDIKPFRNLAIGNNIFKNAKTVNSGSGAIRNDGQTRGVIFNNIFDRVNVVLKNLGNDDVTEWANGHFPFAYGNSDNLFFENNTIRYSTAYAGDGAGWTESGQGGRTVFRYNTWDFTNTSNPDLFDVHGFQNWPDNGQTGTMITEYYGNTITNWTGYRWIAHRGSWGMYFDNLQTASGGTADIAHMQYGPLSQVAGSSGCTVDVPGAKGVYTTEINNTYVFNNTQNGTMMNMSPWFPDGCAATHPSGENVGYWNFNSSFNGTTGIGRGTVTPTGNCTVGVGYWKSNTPTPTTDPNIIQNSTFYKCTAPNTWTAYYTPYPYPHPLALIEPAINVVTPLIGNIVTATSCSYTAVSAAVASANDGDTVMVPAGTCTWTNEIVINKGITIQGAGATQTVLINNIAGVGGASGSLFSLIDGGSNSLRRITQIGMKSNYITNDFAKKGVGVWVAGYGSQKRVDNCQFNDLYVGVYVSNSNGVSDHNSYYNCASAYRHAGFGNEQQYAWNNFRPVVFNSLNYFFHEYETIELTGDSMVADEVEANSYVIRHSNITLREAHGPYSAAQSYPIFDAHGDIPPTGQYAVIATLVYDNDITINQGAAMAFYQLRGGTSLVFNNRVISNGGSGGAGVELREERYEYGLCGVTPPAHSGYECWPAWSDSQYEDVIHNTYIWNNTFNGIVQAPYLSDWPGSLKIGSNPQTSPTANAWTSAPSQLLLPADPHPLTLI